MALGGAVKGSAYLTVSGSVGVASKPKMIYSLCIISGATASVVLLQDNGSSGTIYISVKGAINTGVVFFFENGLFFPDDCYYTADGHQTSVLISYDEIVG